MNNDRDGDQRVIGELLRAWARHRPDRLFLRSGDSVAYTYAELDSRADTVAAGFAALGVKKGDRVGILCPNRPEMIEMYFGLARLGAIQVPLNVYLKGEFLRYQVEDCQASVMVVDKEGRDAIRPLLGELAGLTTVVSLDTPEAQPLGSVAEVAYSTILAADSPPPALEISPADTMSILYTSGTTGYPKGCVVSHGYYTRVGRLVAAGLAVSDDDAIYSPLPLFHSGARMMVLAMALSRGLPLTIDPAFSATNILPRCAEVGATVIIGMGAMGAAMLARPAQESDRAHAVHTMMMVPMSAADQELFRERFGIDPWTEVFGQTECVPVLITPRSHGARDQTSCGAPAPDLEVALLDDDDEPVAAGGVGEICLRPRERFAMFDGYWNKPTDTLQQFRNLWYHTGDNGRQLPSGSFTFVDRKKDALRRRGENVSSLELEASLMRHAKIAEAAVHAVPSELAEDDIKACVVLNAGEAIDAGELFEFFKEHLPYYAIPRYVEVVDSLPRNAVGRVMKFKLRERPISESTWDLEKLGLVVGKDDRRSATAAS